VADNLLDEVGELLRDTADQVVVPLFRKLDPDQVTEKAPGELVTVADQRAEEMISAGLRRLLPGSVVVGEEGVAADPTLLRHLGSDGEVWVVDPVDGTANFAAGRRPFALMVALLRAGEQVAAWVLDPLAGDLAVAGAGTGTTLGGRRVGPAGSSTAPTGPSPTAPTGPSPTAPTGPSPTAPFGRLRGTAMTRYLPPPLRERVETGAAGVADLLPGHHCAGREYLDLLTGEQDFVLFWRTMPWDHAPGTLLVREAGGVARRFDGTEYHPAGPAGQGLLLAVSEEVWQRVHHALLGDLPA
jgi:fructose-1,6-bisphosphatase/inositol monophosphatase family enzyme